MLIEADQMMKSWFKRIFNLRNSDRHVEPFMNPLFNLKETFGYSVDLPIQTPYISRQHHT